MGRPDVGSSTLQNIRDENLPSRWFEESLKFGPRLYLPGLPGAKLGNSILGLVAEVTGMSEPSGIR